MSFAGACSPPRTERRLRSFKMRRLSLALIALMTAAMPAKAQRQKTIAVLTMNDTPQLLEVKDGVIGGLVERGYVEGKNIKIDFKSAQGNFGTAQQIARQFV